MTSHRHSIIDRVTRRRTALVWFAVVVAVYALTTAAIWYESGGQGGAGAMQVVVSFLDGHPDSGFRPGTLDDRDRCGTDLLGHQSAAARALRPVRPVPGSVGVREVGDPGCLRHRCGVADAAARSSLWTRRNDHALAGHARRLRYVAVDLAIKGNFYYLAQVQAMFFCLIALIEWRGRRRAWVIAVALGLSGLARPTTLLAAIPFGIALLAESRDRVRTAIGFGLPLLVTVGLTALYNAARFGSLVETGYGISNLHRPEPHRGTESRESSASAHVPQNLYYLFLRGFDHVATFPFFAPDSSAIRSCSRRRPCSSPCRPASARVPSLLCGRRPILIADSLSFSTTGAGASRHTATDTHSISMPFVLALVRLIGGKPSFRPAGEAARGHERGLRGTGAGAIVR